MNENKRYREGAYSFQIDDKHKLKFYYSERDNVIAIVYVYTNGVISTFAERSFKNSTLAEMRTVFEYLVDYYRTYRER